MSHRLAVATVLLLLAAAGCGAQPSGSQSPSSPAATTAGPAGAGKDACALLTRAEVEGALGRPTDGGMLSTGTASAQRCTYMGTGGALASVSVGLYRGASVDAAKQAYAFVGASNSHPVTDLGDEAKVGTSSVQSGGTIVVRKGSLEIDITIVGAPVPPTEAQLKELVTKALQRS
jgi:hypothetical protein